MSGLEDRLRALSGPRLHGMRRGIEKESLRVQPDGRLAMTPHPAALGAALTHAHITTDFSEAQLELITDPHPSAEACLEELTQIHQVVCRAIGDEILWCASMPCGLPDDDKIPLGRYGTSNIGRAKTVYRNGLAYRYGRRMQMISGIHYNWSLPGLGNDDYFALIRNFRRQAALLFYLFGASPAACATFVERRDHRLQTLKEGTLYLPHATTLRMGRLGYQSDAQASIVASCNSLEAYGASLEQAMLEPYPAYEALGVHGVEGDGKGYLVDGYRQLATTLIQIENEFYGKIRPKCRIHAGERPLHALRERGVEYVEVRLMDLDPFEPVGICARTMRFLDVFLLHCLLTPSPPDTPGEVAALARDYERAASRGREPGLKLSRGAQSVAFAGWGREILAACAPIAARLDAEFGGTAYREALAAATGVLADPALTPSGRVLAAMIGEYDKSYTRFALAQSERHAATLRARPLPEAVARRYAELADESHARQRAMEAADTLPFEAWRQRYLSPEMLKVEETL
jgi:glutamate--cysteine ligase